MQEILNVVVTALGGGLFAAALIKLWISHRFQKEIETHKDSLARATKELESDLERRNSEFQTNLQAQHQIALSKIQSDLQVEASRQIKGYEYLQGQRLEATRKLYELLTKATEAMASLTAAMQFTGEPSQDEKARVAATSFNEFYAFFRVNRILYPEDVCERLESLVSVYKNGFIDYTAYQQWWDSRDAEVRLRDWESRKRAVAEINKAAPGLHRDVEKRLRELLHVV